MTHEDALSIVRPLDITGPAHGTVAGDFDRVVAAIDGRPDVIDALNSLDASAVEETPQGAAAHRGCREILEYMVLKGVCPDVFMMAALAMTDHLRWAIQRRPSLANARGGHGIHVLNHAADRATADLLLAHDADPNYPTYEAWDWTPMHEAAADGRVDILGALCDYGGRVDGGSLSHGYATEPLHGAARNGHADAVRWLLANGAGADAIGKGGPFEGRTVRDVARENGHDAVLHALDALDAWRPGTSTVGRPLPVIRASS